MRHAWVEGGLVDGREASWRVAEGSRHAYLLLQIVVPLRRELPEGLRVKDRRRDIGGLALGLPSDDLLDVACEDPEDAARVLGAEAVHEAMVALLEPRLPPETVLGDPRLHRDDHDLDDPILDGQLAVRTSDPEALRPRLRRDAVRGALLELVHEHPGSVVLSDPIHLVVPGLEVRPARLVELVSELAEGLRGL